MYKVNPGLIDSLTTTLKMGTRIRQFIFNACHSVLEHFRPRLHQYRQSSRAVAIRREPDAKFHSCAR